MTYVPQWASRGSATQFVYFDSNGSATATTQSVGGTVQPIYMKSGVITPITQTVGSALRPAYLNAGKITQVSYNMAATNPTATTAMGLEALENCTTGIWYANGTAGIYGQSDGVIINNIYSSAWQTEIYQDYRTGQLAARGKNNGTWQSWRKILDSSNFSTYLDDTYVNTTGDIIKGSVDLSAAPAAADEQQDQSRDDDPPAAVVTVEEIAACHSSVLLHHFGPFGGAAHPILLLRIAFGHLFFCKCIFPVFIPIFLQIHPPFDSQEVFHETPFPSDCPFTRPRFCRRFRRPAHPLFHPPAG